MLFKKTERDTLAFGKYPSYRKYDLYVERYHSAAKFIQNKFSDTDEEIKILDIGCGDGALKYFFDEYTNVHWDGIEIDEERFEICKKLGYNMHLLDVDEKPLPFADNSFDAVNASHVIEHLKNMPNALKEIQRVTKPGGIIAIGVPIKLPLLSLLRGWTYDIEFKIGKRKKGAHCQAFDVLSLRYKLKKYMPDTKIKDLRGFRLITGRQFFPLEDYKWFYTFYTTIGRILSFMTPEVNVILEKRS